MSRMTIVCAFLALPCPALACSLCGGDLQTRATIRQELAKARIVVAGTLANPRLISGANEGGTTDLIVEAILKDHSLLKGKTQITLQRYLPSDEAGAKFLVIADVVDGKIDVLSGRYVKDERIFDYLKSILQLNEPDGAKRLAFFFQHLDSPVPEIAQDAYLEFAKSTDAEVVGSAKHLDAGRLRKLIREPSVTGDRLGLVAFLLGFRGQASDADLIHSIIKTDAERTRSALRGLLAGYIVIRPKDGWPMLSRMVADTKAGFLDRYAALGVVRLFQNWKPAETRSDVLRVMKTAVEQGDIAEMPIEDLRRWAWWDLTDTVLAQFDKKSHDFLFVRRAIMRYALACPKPEAATFVAAIRKRDPSFVAGVQESLEADK